MAAVDLVISFERVLNRMGGIRAVERDKGRRESRHVFASRDTRTSLQRQLAWTGELKALSHQSKIKDSVDVVGHSQQWQQLRESPNSPRAS
ncbi:hypothetical protein Cni_G19842 [Canna indica]|uniref:Uncharacterized protein n=1 Tax=Canna indica TaxID=4628 RepID=A0AAQ3KS46_9LILI|nr:hypothetical protein Cni_G19842 [Canna indica]